MTSIKARKPEKILLTDHLYILWKDGQESRYAFFDLRDACPCAACIHEITREKILDPQTIPKDIRPLSCSYVGNYALRLDWSDSHNTGIYNFRMLREFESAKTSA